MKRITAYVTGVFVGYDSDSLVTTREREVLVTLNGFEGDKHAGYMRVTGIREQERHYPYPKGMGIRNYRQVSIVSDEELDQIAHEMNVPEIKPEWLGANLSLRGVPRLTSLPGSTRLFFPEYGMNAVIVVDGENLPCIQPGEVIQKIYPDKPKLDVLFPKYAHHRRGLVGWVEAMGRIHENDEVQVIIPE